MKKQNYHLDRTRISEEAHRELKKQAEESGRTITSIAREVLHRWAKKK